MAKSVLELAVGTGQWDAGLKKAKSALDNFTQSQGGLQQALAKDSENMRKFVSMMGQTESTAKTAKGQMNDYKATIEQLTMQYNRMTDAQKKSIGQDYLQSIDQLKQKYQAVNKEIQEMNRSLNNVKVPDIADGVKSGGLFGGGKLDGMLQVFGGNLMTKAAGAVASLGAEMADMVKQGIEMAKAGEGVRVAFERLGNGHILDGLREATHGTVTDIELMKAAVKFNDFKLPLDELGTMLAFAQQKAKDTGQSVDYMVDSIVTGLGRKSLMILDNLGLSASEIRERMKETGDMTKAVGAIIRDQMEAAGDYVETAADRAAQANVSLQNKMEELGRKFAPLEEASNQLWTSMKIGILDVVGGPLATLLNGLTEDGRIMNAYNKMGGNTKVGRMTANLANASKGNRQSIYQQQKEKFWRYINPREQMIKDIRAWQSGERGESLQGRIGAIRDQYGMLNATKIQAEVDAAKKMLSDYEQAAKSILKPVNADINTEKAEQNVASLRKHLNELEAQRKKAVKAGDQELVETLTKQISQTKTNLGYLDPSSVNAGKSKQQQAEEKVAAALLDYNQTIEKASLELEAGVATEADVKKRQFSAQERLYDAYGDAYSLYKDPKYKEAQDQAAAEIIRLGGEVKTSSEAQKQLQEATKQLSQEEKKRAEGLAKLKTEGVTAVRNNDLGAALQVQKKAIQGGFNGSVEIPLTFTYTDNNMAALIGDIKQRLNKADFGSEVYADIQELLSDATAISGLIQLALENGIAATDLESVSQELFAQLLNGDNIDDETIESLRQAIAKSIKKNVKVSEKGGVTTDDKDSFKELTTDIHSVTSGLSSVAAGLNSLGVEIPSGVEKVIGVVNGVMQVITGISQIISVFQTSSTNANTVALNLNTAALYANSAAQGVSAGASAAAGGAMAGAVGGMAAGSVAGPIGMAIGLGVGLLAGSLLFANGGIVPHAANGFMIPGGSFSGDTTPVLANAGELILSRSQQNAIASQLDGNGLQNLSLSTEFDIEKLIITLNNRYGRTGYGEIVTSQKTY